MAQTVKCLPTTRETQVQSLGWADLLEKEMATHSSVLAWKIPWTEEPGRLQSMGLQRSGHYWATSHSFNLFGLQIWLDSKWEILFLKQKRNRKGHLSCCGQQFITGGPGGLPGAQAVVASLWSVHSRGAFAWKQTVGFRPRQTCTQWRPFHLLAVLPWTSR